ncbi:MAG: NAD(P)-binding domain-containing protein, partial [Nevskiaceae bacterium]|nr:NAD(P)-binding domain-containing protein [Nevskiaceae bacterium]
MRIGFVGLGNMGVPMSGNLFRAGHQLIVYDADPVRARSFAQAHPGVVAAASLAEFAPAEVVVTMLPNGGVVREVYLGDGGSASGLAAVLQRGTIAVDMSSADPAGTRALGQALQPFGV